MLRCALVEGLDLGCCILWKIADANLAISTNEAAGRQMGWAVIKQEKCFGLQALLSEMFSYCWNKLFVEPVLKDC